MQPVSPDEQLDGFIDKYTPEVAAQMRLALEKMRALLPGAVEMVYDNYNALVVGFGPTDRASEAVFSIAAYPRYLNLFFLNGVDLPDPDKLLQGNGNLVRSIRLTPVDILDRPEVQTLMNRALDRGIPIEPTQPRKTVIKSISAKQRPRRPR